MGIFIVVLRLIICYINRKGGYDARTRNIYIHYGNYHRSFIEEVDIGDIRDIIKMGLWLEAGRLRHW